MGQLKTNHIREFELLFFRFKAYLNSLGIDVDLRPANSIATGEFHGDLLVVYDVSSWEEKFFNLIHLFGHNVQWLHESPLVSIGVDQPPIEQFESRRKELIPRLALIREYELEASAFGLQGLLEANLEQLTEWFLKWCAIDWEFLKWSYHNGYCEQTAIERANIFSETEAPQIVPIPYKISSPKNFDGRYAF